MDQLADEDQRTTIRAHKALRPLGRQLSWIEDPNNVLSAATRAFRRWPPIFTDLATRALARWNALDSRGSWILASLEVRWVNCRWPLVFRPDYLGTRVINAPRVTAVQTITRPTHSIRVHPSERRAARKNRPDEPAFGPDERGSVRLVANGVPRKLLSDHWLFIEHRGRPAQFNGPSWTVDNRNAHDPRDRFFLVSHFAPTGQAAAIDEMSVPPVRVDFLGPRPLTITPAEPAAEIRHPLRVLRRKIS